MTKEQAIQAIVEAWANAAPVQGPPDIAWAYEAVAAIYQPIYDQGHDEGYADAENERRQRVHGRRRRAASLVTRPDYAAEIRRTLVDPLQVCDRLGLNKPAAKPSIAGLTETAPGMRYRGLGFCDDAK